MRIAIIGILAAIMMSFGVKAYCGQSAGAVAVFVSGEAQLKRSGEKSFSALKVNDMLYSGDNIKTGQGGKVSLVTKGGAEVRLNENSNFELSPQGRVRELFNLSVGQLWTRMLHKMAKVDVRTPSAVCAVRGTEADIEQRSLLTVKVYEGHVDVQNSLGKQALLAGQMTTVSGSNSAPAAPKKMSGSDTGNWQEGQKAGDYDKFLKLLKESAESGKKLDVSVKMPDGTVKKLEGDLKKK